MSKEDKTISILNPPTCTPNYKILSETTVHDLGLDYVCAQITEKKSEQTLILSILSKMTEDPEVTRYRSDVFSDIYRNEAMRNEMLRILDRINFLRDYGSIGRTYEESASVWDLLHRMDELKDYIQCVEAIFKSLSEAPVRSEGLLHLREYIDALYHDNGFLELKKDIEALRATTSDLRSVTVGINLNERFEADGIGLISINNKYFTKSNIIDSFCGRISMKETINPDTEWNGEYKYHPVASAAPLKKDFTSQQGIASVPEGDITEDLPRYMNRVVSQMLSTVVKKLKNILDQYVSVTITDITNLMPEFIYYVRWAEYIERLSEHGLHFCKGTVASEAVDERIMHAKAIYNLKFAATAVENQETVITNDLDFDKGHLVYVLTGANRGGKTTITQAVGLLFVLAQGGIYVPGDSFVFHPVDCIYTHFPADEDKTMDLGRLGEECRRFRQIYSDCTKNSLLLLNETFSTTSFEEGYFIAKDAVKAILFKGIRTIYNTHMHKLAYNLEELNRSCDSGKAVSLVVKADGGNRSFKVEIAPPEGMSYADDIARKYGVTYEMLVKPSSPPTDSASGTPRATAP